MCRVLGYKFYRSSGNRVKSTDLFSVEGFLRCEWKEINAMEKMRFINILTT
jgi:hypothetical protein